MTSGQKLIVTVVIATYNKKPYLKEALSALERQNMDEGLYEVIVVDDGSSDGTEEMLKEISKSLTYSLRIFRQANQGLSAARNLGIKNARSEFIAFHDDDLTARPDWLKNGLLYFKDESVFAVEGRVEVSGTVRPFTHSIANESGGLFLGCNMFYRVRVLDRLNGFDLNIPFFGNDYDLILKVFAIGGRVPFARDAVLVHAVISVKPSDLLKRAADSRYIPYLFKVHGEKIRPYTGFRIERVFIAMFFLLFVYALISLNGIVAACSLLGMALMTRPLISQEIKQASPAELFKAFPVYMLANALTFFIFLYGCIKYRTIPNIKMFRR